MISDETFDRKKTEKNAQTKKWRIITDDSENLLWLFISIYFIFFFSQKYHNKWNFHYASEPICLINGKRQKYASLKYYGTFDLSTTTEIYVDYLGPVLAVQKTPYVTVLP